MKLILLLMFLFSPLLAIRTIPPGIDKGIAGNRKLVAKWLSEISKQERGKVILGEDYEIDGATYTAVGSTAPASGENFVITGETYTYTIYGTTISTSVIVGEYDEAKGGWLTQIAGVIAMVIGGVVYLLRKK